MANNTLKVSKNNKTNSVNLEDEEIKQRQKTTKERNAYSKMDTKLKNALENGYTRASDPFKLSAERKTKAQETARKSMESVRQNAMLNTSKKLNNDQKSQARQEVDDYFANNEIAKTASRMQTSNPTKARAYLKENMTPEQIKEFERMSALNSKAGKFEDITSAFSGAFSKLPFSTQITRGYDKAFDRYGSTNTENTMQNSKTQSPIANLLGEIGMVAAENSLATNVIPGANSGNFARNVLTGQGIDTALETLPKLATDIQDGKSGKEVAKNFLINELTNLPGNLLGAGIDYKLNRATLEREAKAIQQASDELYDINKAANGTLPGLEDAIKTVEPDVPQLNPMMAFQPKISGDEAKAINKALDTQKNTELPDLMSELGNVDKELDDLEKLDYLRPQDESRVSELLDLRADLESKISKYNNRVSNGEGNYISLGGVPALKKNSIDSSVKSDEELEKLFNELSSDTKTTGNKYLDDMMADLDNTIKNANANAVADDVKVAQNQINGTVPSVNSTNNLSQHYETVKNSKLYQTEAGQKQVEYMRKNGVFDKGEVENRAKSMAQASKNYFADKEGVTNNLLNGDWNRGGLDIDESAIAIKDAFDNGNYALANRLARVESMNLSNAGRELRAVQDNYVATAEGTIQKATQYLVKESNKILQKESKASKEIKALAESVSNSKNASELVGKIGMDASNVKAVQEAIDLGADAKELSQMIAMYQKTGATQLSDDTINFIKDVYKQIDASGLGVDSKARAELESQVYSRIANELGGKRSLAQKWDAWRYLAMLGNTRTHVRNMLGNSTQYMLTEVKDNIGALMESAVSNINKSFGGEGIDRTKAVLNRLSEEDNLLIKAARMDADDKMFRVLNDSGNKYNEISDVIKRNQDAFDSKFMNAINNFNSNALEAEDYFGLKNKYSKAIARYLKANGADSSIFKANDEASLKLLEKAREYATTEAKRATFHEYSVVADWLSKTSNNLRNGENANAYSKLGGVVIESLVPFKKTPINVLKQGLKYSPISIAKALSKDATALAKGTITASEMIEDLASGMTGTMVLGLGAFLASQGMLNGKGDDDYNVNNANKRQGKQEYAIQIGNKSYTLDWLAPFSLPLFVGAELFNGFKKDGEDEGDALDKFIGALSTIAEPITEMSMLQGINDTLEQLSYSKESAIGTFAGNLATGYVTQGVPTLFGQVARSVDPTRRSTYTDQQSGVKKQIQRNLLKSVNKIPGLSERNEEFVNEWGESEENTGGNVLGRLAYNMLSPGYYMDNSNATALDNELQRLYQETGESPFIGTSSGKVGDSKLSREKYTDYQKLYGRNNKAIAESIMKNDAYNSLSDFDKVEVIKNAYKISKYIADYEVGGKNVPDNSQKLYDVYKKTGINGVAESLISSRQEKIKKEELEAEAISNGYVKENGKADTTAYKKAIEVQDKYGKDADAYMAITRTQNGTNKNGDAKYLDYNEKNLQVYNDKGQNGLDTLVTLKGNIESDKVGDIVDTLDSTNLSEEDKAYYFTKLKSGDLASVPRLFDNDYDVYQWYYIKNLLDSDGNGSLKKSEKQNLVPMLTNMGYDQNFINMVTSQSYTLDSGKTKKGWY